MTSCKGFNLEGLGHDPNCAFEMKGKFISNFHNCVHSDCGPGFEVTHAKSAS